MTHYFGSALASFENGCQMDLTLKLAIEFLKASDLTVPYDDTDDNGDRKAAAQVMAHRQAEFALLLANSLLTQAAEHGNLKPMPDHGELSAAEKRHVERSTRQQIYQQSHAPKWAEEEAPKVQTAGAVPFMGRGIN